MRVGVYVAVIPVHSTLFQCALFAWGDAVMRSTSQKASTDTPKFEGHVFDKTGARALPQSTKISVAAHVKCFAGTGAVTSPVHTNNICAY